MTTQEQDNLWNDLSEEDKAHYQEQYAEQKTMSSGVPKLLEELFGSHNLKTKTLTYDMIAMEMYYEERTGTTSVVLPTFSDAQADKLCAIHQLITVAKYLNKDWEPDWENDKEEKYHISLRRDKIIISYLLWDNSCIAYFPTKGLAQQAIQILGEETIRLALSTDY